MSSSSQSAVRVFPTFDARDRSLSVNSGLASFPHEGVELIRALPPTSTNALNLATCSSGTANLRSVPLLRWPASHLTPRYLRATTHQLPPPLGVLRSHSAAGSGSSSAEVVGKDIYYHNRNVCKAGQESEGTGTCRSRGELNNATASESVDADISGTARTMSAALTCLPLSVARPLMIPQPLAPAVTVKSISRAPTRKRKKVSGVMRMRNFLCMHPRCGKSFTDSAHLRDHTVVHTGEKKLSCSICQKLFARASTLQEHSRVHTGEKPYVCGIPGCSKRYSSRAAMRFHRTSHASQFSLTAEQNLNSSIHAGIGADPVQVQRSQTSSYVCPRCGKQFCERELLMAHVKSHTAHRVASLAPFVSVTAATSQPKSVEEETSAGPGQVDGEVKESPCIVRIPSADESLYLYETIRAQQIQIEQLKAAILRLRGQASIDPAATSVQTGVAGSNKPALTAPVEMLRDGCKPFACCICNNRFANFYQLNFHGKQHPEAPMAEVIGEQAPLPVGPKHCPEEECEYAKTTGKSLKNLQTLKRHWQRRHQNERPYMCSRCPATRQKTFKTRENLKAHEKDCTKNFLVQ